MADLELEALHEAAQNALLYAIMGPDAADPFGDAIESIVAMGPRAVHAALSGWSGLTLHGFEQDQGPAGKDAWWGVEVEDARTGKVVSLDKVSDPATRDAMRLVACVGNKDHATIAAIVETAWDADETGETLASLMVRSVMIAADTAERLREQREANEEPS